MEAKPYEVLVGLSYPPYGKGVNEVRALPGDVVNNLPPDAIADLLEQGCIGEPEQEGD